MTAAANSDSKPTMVGMAANWSIKRAIKPSTKRTSIEKAMMTEDNSASARFSCSSGT